MAQNSSSLAILVAGDGQRPTLTDGPLRNLFLFHINSTPLCHLVQEIAPALVYTRIPQNGVCAALGTECPRVAVHLVVIV